MAAAASSPFRSLRYTNARWFFGGMLVSNVGTWLQMTAMALLVYRLTGRAGDFGTTLLFQFAPTLVLGAWAGAVADRHDRLRMTFLTQSLLAVQALVLGVVVLTGHESVPMIYALSFVLGVINAFDNPARRGFVTELVPREDIANAVSLNTSVMTGSRIFGPALGAFMVNGVGAGWCFIVNGVSFAAVLGTLLVIRRDQLFKPVIAKRGGTPVRDAIRFIRGVRTLWVSFWVLIIVSTFAFNYNVALPKLADVRWGDDSLYGWLLTVMSIGSVTGSLLTARLHRVTQTWFFANTTLLGLSAIAVAWAPNIWIAYLAVVPLGIGGAGFMTGINSISQQESPDDMRGRIMALIAVAFLGSTPIGSPITGQIADKISPEWAMGYGGVITLATVAIAVVVLHRSPATVGTHGVAHDALVVVESGGAG